MRLRLSPHSERDLSDLPSNDFRRAVGRILSLGDSPPPSGVRKLGDKSFRIRVSPWRIFYPAVAEDPACEVRLRLVSKVGSSHKIVDWRRLKSELYLDRESFATSTSGA